MACASAGDWARADDCACARDCADAGLDSMNEAEPIAAMAAATVMQIAHF
jgi:hypothetical protein